MVENFQFGFGAVIERGAPIFPGRLPAAVGFFQCPVLGPNPVPFGNCVSDLGLNGVFLLLGRFGPGGQLLQLIPGRVEVVVVIALDVVQELLGLVDRRLGGNIIESGQAGLPL